MKTEHSISICHSPEEAFQVGLNVAKWPEIFPPCLEADVLSETETEQAITLTARANGQILSWQSIRQIDRKRRLIKFRQNKPSPLVKSMVGSWTFDPLPKGCKISLMHEFEIADQVKGFVPEVETKEQAMQFMERSIEVNSNRELSAIAKHLDQKAWHHSFSETMILHAPKNLILDLIWNAEEWPTLLPHCSNIRMIYSDSVNQEFVMSVNVANGTEEIRSIRRKDADAISYFQPSPPEALLEHRGSWTFSSVNEGSGIAVTSYHEVLLNPLLWAAKGSRNEAKQKIETAINLNSFGTMKAIKARFEGRLNA